MSKASKQAPESAAHLYSAQRKMQKDDVVGGWMVDGGRMQPLFYGWIKITLQNGRTVCTQSPINYGHTGYENRDHDSVSPPRTSCNFYF